MSASIPAENPPGETGNQNRTLRTCLIVGAGCAGIGLILLCILVAMGVPVVNSIMRSVNWTQGEALIEAIPGIMGDAIDAPLLELIPTEINEFVPVPAPDVSFQGVSFSYPAFENFGADGTVLQAESGEAWFSLPERVVFSLDDYPIEGAFHEPQILVMRTDDLLEVNSEIALALDELKGALVAQARNIERVPFVMPGFNAAQMITTQVVYLPFEGGQGVRFVTQYGQAAWPINNHDLFYAFQGLTDDGVYLVTAVLPVTHPSLPADGESAIGEDYEAFIAGFEAALVETKASLDAQAPDSFAPGLLALDAMMGSLQVEAP
ncbi:MAG: hypothetical protein E4G99_00455 [Anaerolineales bacterium]|nr:MAG: hypothetical protein E4G99_00455 [Anaerolineales bacterium]